MDNNFTKITTKSESKLHGYLTLIGGMSIHLFCGNLYLWGNIANYVVSYFHFKGDKTASLQVSVSILPISILMQAIFNLIGAFMLKKVNPKIVMLSGSALMIGSIYIVSQVDTWQSFVICYAIIFPMGIGLVYWTPIICAWQWFPQRKGLISGLVIGAFGFGAFIFGFLSTAIVNPDNI